MSTSAKIKGIVQAIHNKWSAVKDSSPVFANGYTHFFSPPTENPELMIIGLNSNADVSTFSEATAQDLPTAHNYFEQEHELGRKMKKLFEQIGQTEALKNSVKVNLLFFRSSSIGEWHSVAPEQRAELEAFFETQLRDIVNTLKPKRIICEGLETLERVKTIFGSNHKSIDTKSPERRTVYRTSTITLADESKVQLIGIMHPAARLSFGDFDAMADALKKELAN